MLTEPCPVTGVVVIVKVADAAAPRTADCAPEAVLNVRFASVTVTVTAARSMGQEGRKPRMVPSTSP